MNISSVSNSALDALGGISPAMQGATQPASSSGGPASTSLSSFGKFLNDMQQMEQTNPAAAKQALSQVADQLRTAAKGMSGPAADRLNQMADKFQQASATGDLSTLKPPMQAHHGGGHHHHGGSKGAAAYAQQSDSSVQQIVESAIESVAPTS